MRAWDMGVIEVALSQTQVTRSKTGDISAEQVELDYCNNESIYTQAQSIVAYYKLLGEIISFQNHSNDQLSLSLTSSLSLSLSFSPFPLQTQIQTQTQTQTQTHTHTQSSYLEFLWLRIEVTCPEHCWFLTLCVTHFHCNSVADSLNQLENRNTPTAVILYLQTTRHITAHNQTWLWL